jgi:hypothetical protein
MTKKIFIGIAAAMTLALSGASMAVAETATTTATSTATTTASMEQLLQQIKALQDKLAELRKQQEGVMGQLKETIALARDLRQGMDGEDIKALQEILAADSDVYPEGLVTGHFGPLTAKAIMKFQMKHGIEAVGLVGPKTRQALNGLAGNHDFKCRAWGHLFAPGYMKKHLGNADIDLSDCKVPEGIKEKLDGDWKHGTTTRKTKTTATSTGTTTNNY